MFSKLKNFFDTPPPAPPETLPNPLYAMLAADTAAMEAGKKQAKSALHGKSILRLIP